MRDDGVLVVLTFHFIKASSRPTFLALFGRWSQVHGQADALGNQPTNRQTKSNVGGGDGCTPGASIGIENIAIHVQGNGAKGFKVNGSSQGACNQAFNLLGSSFGSSAFPSESRIR